jgi:hypothetical protein
VTTNNGGPGPADPNYADLPEVHRLGVTLNRLNATYGSGKHFPVWDTEYAYRTRPPDPHAGVSLATQAYYLNWGEYLHYKQPGIASFDQYLLTDPVAHVFASGLEFANGRQKPSFDAFRMPLYLPVTSTSRGRTLEVWGDVRPAHFASGPQVAQIQWQGGYNGSTFITLQTVRLTNREGYFDVRVGFPSSGTVRTAWTTPGGQTIYSRTQTVTIH